MKTSDKRIPIIWLFSLCLIGILIGISIVSGAVSNSHRIPQTAHIDANLSVKITVNGADWNNGSAIDWGAILPGQTYTKIVAITNNGTSSITSITLASDSTALLPVGWTETLSSFTGTLTPSQIASGTLTLIVPSTATAGSYSWNNYILTS
jgi:hypothetical protein